MQQEVRAAACLPVTLWLAFTLEAGAATAGLLVVDSLDISVEVLPLAGSSANRC